MDPYDYDTILFILKLVKELSREETAPTVDKVEMQFVYDWASKDCHKCS